MNKAYEKFFLAVPPEALDLLPPRWKTCIQLRLGLSGEIAHTQKAVGRRLVISTARVGQIERAAFYKLLRVPEYRSMLRDLQEDDELPGFGS